MNSKAYSFPFLNSFFFLKHDVQIGLIKEDRLREELIKRFSPTLFGKRPGEWQLADLAAEYSLHGAGTQNYHSETGYEFCLTSSWVLSNY